MGELPRNVREFIVRDLIYVVGGGIVLTSFLYRFDRLPDQDTPLAFYLLGAGVAYVLGSSLQDLFSILRLVTTAKYPKPNRLVRWMHRRFTAEEWKDLPELDSSEIRSAIRKVLKDDLCRTHYERTISGMILAATMGPCTLVSGLLVSWRWLASSSGFDLAVAVTSLVLSVGLFALTWLRAAQVTRIDADALADYRDTRKGVDVSSEQ